jgi:hypothetical protein
VAEEPPARAACDVLEALRAPTRPGGQGDDYQPLPGRTHVYGHESPGRFRFFLVLSQDHLRAIKINIRGDSYDPVLVEALLDFASAHRDELHAIECVGKLKLPRHIGPFTHFAMLGPTVARAERTRPAVVDQIGQGFPIFDCEFSGEEGLGLAEARRDLLPFANWKRIPVPVVDLRFEAIGVRAGRSPDFRVYPPGELPKRIAWLATSTPGSWLEVRNFRLETQRVRWDGHFSIEGDTLSGKLGEADLVARLQAFVHG